ncbi:transposase [Hungatella sp. L12]|uniref:Transposase n=1 Tax=Hungatella hominis TaxID=2763050 RepID=A0ABR7HGR3_9FIRM|nr:transposase [Hungatella hominis]MBC5712343.1 transposase [Hungatella hominis]
MAKGKYEYWLSPDGLLKLEAWARDGLIDEQIAENIGINPATLYDWKKKYPEISEALKKGKEVVDIEVENALLKRALGYEYTETKTEEYMVEGVPVKRVTKTVKEVIPDTTAQIFWLKNRRPMQWRDKHDMELSGEVKTGNPYAGLTTEELRKLIHGG